MSKTRRRGRNGAMSVILLMATAILGAVALPLRAAAYQQQIESAAGKVGEAMSRAGRKTVAVVDFTDLQGNVTELGRFLAEQLSVALAANQGSFEVIDRGHLKALVQEHRLSASGLIDAQTARKLGQITGAESLVSGSITPFAENVNLSIKLLDTNTAKILGSTTIDIPRTSTINELLAKGAITQLLGGQATPTGAADAMSPSTTNGPNGSVAVREVVYEIEVSIKGCRRTGAIARCEGVLRNLSDSPLEFLVEGIPEIVDDLGNRSGAEVDFGSASPRSSTSASSRPRSSGPTLLNLEPALPVKFWIDDVEVAPEATSLSARMTVYVAPSGSTQLIMGGHAVGSSKGRRTAVVLRKIALR